MALLSDLLIADALKNDDLLTGYSPFSAALIDTPIQFKTTIEDDDYDTQPTATARKLGSVRSEAGLNIDQVPAYFISRHFAKSYKVVTEWQGGEAAIGIDQIVLVNNYYAQVVGEEGEITGLYARPSSFSDYIKGSRAWTDEVEPDDPKRILRGYAAINTYLHINSSDDDGLNTGSLQLSLLNRALTYHADTGVFSAEDISLLVSLRTETYDPEVPGSGNTFVQGGLGFFAPWEQATSFGKFCGMDVAIKEGLGIEGTFDVTFEEFLAWDD